MRGYINTFNTLNTLVWLKFWTTKRTLLKFIKTTEHILLKFIKATEQMFKNSLNICMNSIISSVQNQTTKQQQTEVTADDWWKKLLQKTTNTYTLLEELNNVTSITL